MQFHLPELGEGVNEGELVKWRVKPGDMVLDDQPLCDVMTDKATIEIPSHFSGTVTELLAKEGEIVKVGQVLMTGEATGAAKAATPAAATTAALAPQQQAPALSASAPTSV